LKYDYPGNGIKARTQVERIWNFRDAWASNAGLLVIALRDRYPCHYAGGASLAASRFIAIERM
jgi:hypothetical protein